MDNLETDKEPRHRTIVGIKTRVVRKKLFVIVNFSSENYVFISYEQIKQNTGLEAFEIELLLGSTMRVDYYRIGEMMFNEKVCQKANTFMKEYYIELVKPIQKLRIESANQLLSFDRITEIFYFHKHNVDKVGIKTSDDKIHYLTEKSFQIVSGLDRSEQHILIGSFVSPQYYVIGETLLNGSLVTQDNKLVKYLNLRYLDKVTAMHEIFEKTSSIHEVENDVVEGQNYNEFFGYKTMDDMIFNDIFDGDRDAWNSYDD